VRGGRVFEGSFDGAPFAVKMQVEPEGYLLKMRGATVRALA
jgi:hypothetical protein